MRTEDDKALNPWVKSLLLGPQGAVPHPHPREATQGTATWPSSRHKREEGAGGVGSRTQSTAHTKVPLKSACPRAPVQQGPGPLGVWLGNGAQQQAALPYC